MEGIEEKDPVYFNYYGQLMHQQNMLEDTIRTDMYYQAIMQNRDNFAGKVVLDVGAGTGILSFFAAQAGAKRVYAVEASNMAQNADLLVKANGFEGIITVIKGKIEEIELPEKVDVIISEPMGVLLFHERMIESYLYARDKFLKPLGFDGKRFADWQMFPSTGSVFLAPFTDSTMYADMKQRSKFWNNKTFYGVDLSALTDLATDQYFSQPIVGGFDPKTLLSEPLEVEFSFLHDPVERLLEIMIPFDFNLKYTGIIHGIAGWFNVGFTGKTVSMELSTAPELERTHWQQVRFMFRRPLGVNHGQNLPGTFKMTVNNQRSYNISIRGGIEGIKPIREEFLLQDQQYYNLQATSYPETSPEYLNLYQ